MRTAALLSDSDCDVRMWVLRAMARLPPHRLAEYAPVVVKKLVSDKDQDVRMAAAQALVCLHGLNPHGCTSTPHSVH